MMHLLVSSNCNAILFVKTNKNKEFFDAYDATLGVFGGN